MTCRVTRPRSKPDPVEEHPYLLVPREQFADELDERIAEGKRIASRNIGSREELDAARSDYYTWDEYNQELLKRRFTTTSIAEGYSEWAGMVVGAYDTLDERIDDFRGDVQNKLRRLVSVRERLSLLEVAASVAPATPTRRNPLAATSIFIVHGQNDAAKLAVQGFIREVTPLDPVVLGEEASRGQTIIEKFESVGASATFAVVILTADDLGRLATSEGDSLKPRGRQNVVFEFGYFVGVIGRAHVAVLYEDGVELPSDVQGLVYIPYDSRGAWKMLLARELKAAGIEVDANKMI